MLSLQISKFKTAQIKTRKTFVVLLESFMKFVAYN